MKRIKLLFLALLVVSCSNKNKDLKTMFDEEVVVNHTVVATIKEPMVITNLNIIGESIVATSGAMSNQHNVIEFDMSGEVVNRYIQMGQAENEAIWLLANRVLDDKVYSYDINYHKLLSFELGGVVDVNKIDVGDKFDLVTLVPIEGSRYLMYGKRLNQAHPFMITDCSLNEISTFGNFVLNKESVLVDEHMPMYGDVFANKSGNKFVYTSLGGNVIQFYDIKNEPDLIAEYDFDVPLLTSVVDGDMSYIEKSPNNVIGTINVATSDKYCYILNSPLLESDKEDGRYSSNTILIFDWEGKPVKKITTSLNLLSLAASDDNELYGLTTNDDEEYLVVKLDI